MLYDHYLKELHNFKFYMKALVNNPKQTVNYIVTILFKWKISFILLE